MLAKGDKVVIADPSASDFAAGESNAKHLFALDCDLVDPISPETVLAFCRRQAGPPDRLFINMNQSFQASLNEWSTAHFDRELLVNLTMPFLFARTVALDMQRRRSGAIVFTTSTAGLNGSAGKAPFHAAKAALSGLARALADELGPYNIRVSCLLPGWINSPYGRPEHGTLPVIPLGRMGEMDDVAMAAAFLLAAPYVHGVDLVVDGGFTATGSRQTNNKSATI
jgi:3-oxoacyl-[acyl-carrier protein] reductase